MAKGKKPLTLKSTVRTLSLKFYLEQITETLEELKERVKNMPKEKYQGLGVVHDKDYQCDSYWEPSIEKLHIHIIIRVLNAKTTQVDTILNMLKIQYRPEIDDILWQNHGAETCADFTAMAMYLTHETEQAILDGKHKYDITEVFSNLTQEEIEEVRQGYIRFSNGLGKKSFKDLAEIDEFAYNLGLIYGNFDEWYNSLDFGFRSNTKIKTIKESYYRGVDVSFNKNDPINRLCIFIQGEKNTGKTYASREALKGKKYLEISGGGTGKYDKLQPSTEAILLSDDTSSSLLNMTDNYPCRAYKRQSNNPIWAGQYFIVTSNLSFFEWLDVCGFKNEENINAMESRFYICHIEEQYHHNTLVCEKRSERGDVKDQQEKINMFIDFKNKFNKIIEEYNIKEIKIDSKDVFLTPKERMKNRIKTIPGTLKKEIYKKIEEIKEEQKYFDKKRNQENEQQKEYDKCSNKIIDSNISQMDIDAFTEIFKTIPDIAKNNSFKKICDEYVFDKVNQKYNNILDSKWSMRLNEEQILSPLRIALFTELFEQYEIVDQKTYEQAVLNYKDHSGPSYYDVRYGITQHSLNYSYNLYCDYINTISKEIEC